MFFYLWSKLNNKARGSAIIGSKIDKASKIQAGCHIVNSTFDRYSFCGYDCEIVNCDVGAFCSIASNVVIGGNNHPMNWVSMSPVFYAGRDSIKRKFSTYQRDEDKRTLIGNDVWIGEKVIIKQGVSVGTGSVIGMGSVVTKDVEPYAIVGGCPARFIRKRFDEQIVSKLLDTRWWEFSDDLLYKYAEYIKNPEMFIRKVNEE